MEPKPDKADHHGDGQEEEMTGIQPPGKKDA
jgi:hypothetical protein